MEGYIHEKPGACGAEEDLSVFPLAIVGKEVPPAGFRDFQRHRGPASLGASELVRCTFVLAHHVSLDIFFGLLDISCHIKGVPRGFRES